MMTKLKKVIALMTALLLGTALADPCTDCKYVVTPTTTTTSPTPAPAPVCTAPTTTAP